MCFAVTERISVELNENRQKEIKLRNLYFSSVIMRYGHCVSMLLFVSKI